MALCGKQARISSLQNMVHLWIYSVSGYQRGKACLTETEGSSARQSDESVILRFWLKEEMHKFRVLTRFSIRLGLGLQT